MCVSQSEMALRSYYGLPSDRYLWDIIKCVVMKNNMISRCSPTLKHSLCEVSDTFCGLNVAKRNLG